MTEPLSENKAICRWQCMPLHDISLTDVLSALADPTRLLIIKQLKQHGACRCCDFKLGLSKSTLSHHIKILYLSGIVASCHQGTSRYNILREQELQQRFPGLLNAVLTAN
ncbi:ArsR/SmtB family transcription factor [Celerinatantimonas diazotrophica]|uniref:DNA-binding transcriptional ArsR family regulator n=1 Tax=Celerinatantimonas diazotrophica TaxID=412034 RepID=A0A4R1JAL2_9GAMM|nr:helix-turn-helix transcriptional regulator [Celerinatantimonas diazotrophica]TCK47580.1 DNA-binding transcriptional ArsR family regulator [Celerinatantimonas diazotrophica]CAG9296797.1 hypothetical protein CEDIAZO_01955 [Celerinatantimonas diazotrophica]